MALWHVMSRNKSIYLKKQTIVVTTQTALNQLQCNPILHRIMQASVPALYPAQYLGGGCVTMGQGETLPFPWVVMQQPNGSTQICAIDLSGVDLRYPGTTHCLKTGLGFWVPAPPLAPCLLAHSPTHAPLTILCFLPTPYPFSDSPSESGMKIFYSTFLARDLCKGFVPAQVGPLDCTLRVIQNTLL